MQPLLQSASAANDDANSKCRNAVMGASADRGGRVSMGRAYSPETDQRRPNETKRDQTRHRQTRQMHQMHQILQTHGVSSRPVGDEAMRVFGFEAYQIGQQSNTGIYILCAESKKRTSTAALESSITMLTSEGYRIDLDLPTIKTTGINTPWIQVRSKVCSARA